MYEVLQPLNGRNLLDPHALTRRQVANRVGLSYGNLRIYEKALQGALCLTEGPNRTLLYDEGSFGIPSRTVLLKRQEGWTVKQAAAHVLRRSLPVQHRTASEEELAGLRKDVQALSRQNQALFRIGVRLVSRFDELHEQCREVLAGRRQSDQMITRLPRAVNE